MNRSCRLFLGTMSWVIVTLGMTAGAAPGTLRFQFKEPVAHAYLLPEPGPRLQSVSAREEWVEAVRDDGYRTPFKFGSRVLLQLESGASLSAVTSDLELPLVEVAAPGLFVLQAEDPWHAAREAQRLAQLPGVALAHPVMKQPVRLMHRYSTLPNDPYYDQQWHLENRATNGTRLGPDINARAGWPFATGSGVPVAIVDEGIELTHPDLVAAVQGMPHFNFYTSTTNGGPSTPAAYHGTAVAGLVGARRNNRTGVSGVAPDTRLAAWTIFDFNDVASPQQLRDMFQFKSNTIPVQNHSWSFSDFRQLSPGPLELTGISNAITHGRSGKGVVMVRSAGNDRQALVNSNDDGYAKDPRIITVGAIRRDGQNAGYSNPSACMLVAAPSGDQSGSFEGLLTADLLGSAGLNSSTGSPDFQNYTFFSGTSASAPLISGIAAMLLEINPDLTYRDVQHLLLLAAKHTDPGDPNMRTNQAGFRVSHNTGFGVPDAGRAVRLARNWPLRPPLTNVVHVNELTNQIPNLGLRLEVFGNSVPVQLASIVASPGVGEHPEALTAFYPLVDVGWATAPIAADLTGKAALIRRGTNTFREKIDHASAAGAALAVVANNPGDNQYLIMQGTHRSTIPAVFINGSDGTALRNYAATNATAQVRSILFATMITNLVTTPLLVEHVGVRIKTDHLRRGDLRIVLISPSGLRSELQHLNDDESGGPVDWTYYSTHHFNESSQGVWTIMISDEMTSLFGNVTHSELIISGVAITDQDKDGLDDNWELQHFGHLASGPAEDADFDGDSNMYEHLAGTDPLADTEPFSLDVVRWNADFVRLGWPSMPGRSYDILGKTNVTVPFNVLTNVPGGVDSGEWFAPNHGEAEGYFQIRSRAE